MANVLQRRPSSSWIPGRKLPVSSTAGHTFLLLYQLLPSGVEEGAPSSDMEVVQNSNSGPNYVEEEIQDPGIHKRLQMLTEEDSRNFDSWSSLVADVEKICVDDKVMISSAYDSFLLRFPLCHWCWSRYAYHAVRISLDPLKAVEIFEWALNSAMYSLGLWIDYCQFGKSFYEDKCAVSRLFKTAILFVGKGYLSHALWDLYMKHEHSQRNWKSVANIYLQVLRYPTEKLHIYYKNFLKFVAGMVEEETRRLKIDSVELEEVVQTSGTTTYYQQEIINVIEDLHNPSNEALRAEAIMKYKLIGDQLYQKACMLDDKIKEYEKNIQRRYFHMGPLDDDELKNWHMYLDYIDKQGDFLWAVQLYERCLISCANYPEFWMRYVEFVNSKGGRELANFALERATGIFLKGVKEMHLFDATYKERIGDAGGARAAFIQFDDKSASNLTRHVIELANMERRLGNLEGAYDIYDKAISMAEDKKQWHSFSTLFIHLSRLKYTITRSTDAAGDVLIDGIRRGPHCKLLLEELIKFAIMHQEAIHGDLLDSIIADAISAKSVASQALDSKDREDISFLYLEFVDLCGTVDDVRKARNRHIHLFPHLVRDNNTSKKPKLGNYLPIDDVSKQRQYLQLESQQSKTNYTAPDQDAPKMAHNSADHNGEEKAEPMNITTTTTSTAVDLTSQSVSEPNSLSRNFTNQLTTKQLCEPSQVISLPEQTNEPNRIPGSFEEKTSAVSTMNHQEKTLEEIGEEGLDKNQSMPDSVLQGENSEIHLHLEKASTNQIQTVNNMPGQSQSQSQSPPQTNKSQMPNVSQSMTHSASNYNQAWDQMWQYQYYYQQQQQYQLQLYQSMQQQQQLHLHSQLPPQQLSQEQQHVSSTQQLQSYSQQQYYYQQENVPANPKGHVQDQHTAHAYQAQWQQYQLQQQAYMLQWQQQQQQHLQYSLPPQQEHRPILQGEENVEQKKHSQQENVQVNQKGHDQDQHAAQSYQIQWQQHQIQQQAYMLQWQQQQQYNHGQPAENPLPLQQHEDRSVLQGEENDEQK